MLAAGRTLWMIRAHTLCVFGEKLFKTDDVPQKHAAAAYMETIDESALVLVQRSLKSHTETQKGFTVELHSQLTLLC